MSDEYIKEIVIALINNDRIYPGGNNETTAQEIAKMIKALRQELNDVDNSHEPCCFN